MQDNNSNLGIIALSLLKGIGPAFVKKALSNNGFKNKSTFDELNNILSLNNKAFKDDEIYQAIEQSNEILFKCGREGISIINLLNDNYPVLLKDLKDCPSVIYCKGNLNLLHQRTVCIIGTREPNENAVKISERVGEFYSKHDWIICNGLAEGVDSSSIKLNGQIHHNKVVGILAGGLNYNSKKTLLRKISVTAEKVIENNGLLISEMPPDKKEDTYTVVKSCRLQAGLSNGLIIIQSSLNGGSRFTVKSFCETRRPVAVINPVQSDYGCIGYNANLEIIENGKKGLAKFTELKEDKIRISKIIILKSKDNYEEFEKVMLNEMGAYNYNNPLLFN